MKVSKVLSFGPFGPFREESRNICQMFKANLSLFVYPVCNKLIHIFVLFNIFFLKHLHVVCGHTPLIFAISRLFQIGGLNVLHIYCEN